MELMRGPPSETVRYAFQKLFLDISLIHEYSILWVKSYLDCGKFTPTPVGARFTLSFEGLPLFLFDLVVSATQNRINNLRGTYARMPSTTKT